MDRCRLCPNAYNVVPCDGPVDARILAIGEHPSKFDHVMGYQEGQEYNDNYLPLAGLDRHNIRQGNVVSCRPEQNKKPNDELARCCAEHHLMEEFKNESLEVVLLLGATACDTLVPGIDLESQHGIPFRAEIYGWMGWVVALYHPAAGLHNTAMMTPLLEDFTKLKPWLEPDQYDKFGAWQWAVSGVGRTRDYRLAKSWEDVNQYFVDYPHEKHGHNLFGGDTESHAGVDFSIQVSIKPGTGLMVLMTDEQSLVELSFWMGMLVCYGYELVLHNAEADLELFQKLLEPSQFTYRDTMIEAYELQNLPQKLKALSYRLLGRKRQSWQQVVGGYSRDALMRWLYEARDIASEEFKTVTPQVSVKTGKAIKPKITKSPLEGLFNRLMTHTSKPQSEDSQYDPWKKLKDYEWSVQTRIHMAALIERVGPVPLLGIANCPLVPVARDYGCSDADDTLALAYELDRLRKEAEKGWAVQEQDIDGPRVEMMPQASLTKNRAGL